MVCLYSVKWQLCDVELDRSESNDLSAQQLRWVGRVTMLDQTFDLVQSNAGETLVLSASAQYGRERIGARALSGWLPRAAA